MPRLRPLLSLYALRILRASALVLATLGGVGCGGSSGSTPDAESPTSAPAASEPVEASTADEDAPPSPPPPAPRCDDGSCFECGEGSCPQGFYCDTGAVGGPACSWLPECAKEPTCACLKKALGKDCTCESSGGGVHLTCN